MTGRATEVTIVSALALILTLAAAAPVLRAPSERIFGRETVGRHHDPFTAMRQFERPVTRGIYLQPFTDIPGALLARLSGGVAAYNWLVLLTFPLSAAAAYVLARHFTIGPVSAGFAAIAFAFSPFHLAHSAYHPHIAQTQWMPLYLVALWRCLDRSTPSTVGVLVASTAAVVLSNFYGGLIAAVITPAAIGGYWLCKARFEPHSFGRLATTVATVVVLSGAGIAYGWFAAPGVASNPAAYGFERDELFRYSAKWWSYLVPPMANPVVGGIAERVWTAAAVRDGLLEQQVSLGWGVVALGLVAISAWLIHRRSSLPSSLAAVPVLVIVATVALVCSLSPERTVGAFTFTRPSALLYDLLPMFRSYARFGVVVQLMSVLLAAVGAERLWRSGTGFPRAVCVALVALAAAEYAVWSPTLWRDVLPTAAHRWVASQPGRLLVVDCTPLTAEAESVHWLSRSRIPVRPPGFEDCSEPRLADKLSAGAYTHLLVPLNTDAGRRLAARGAPEGLQLAARFPDADVFAVSGATPVVHTAQMWAFYPREYDGAWTWRWMGHGASWTVVNSSTGTVGASARLELIPFPGTRQLTLLLDGREVQTLTIQEGRRMHLIGPLPLSPGRHELAFRPSAHATVADDVLKNGDRRALSFGFGGWAWTVDEPRP